MRRIAVGLLAAFVIGGVAASPAVADAGTDYWSIDSVRITGGDTPDDKIWATQENARLM
ncbi:hypothetical protein [Nonomuraea basaltis]|uniref:hypothetical protein n=1 Tax=Nonomuraea basaltis TaxID=2495887 RepID=UPI0014864207|nr:hypothetical protein [Nonomuraea basaltis]